MDFMKSKIVNLIVRVVCKSSLGVRITIQKGCESRSLGQTA
jgi:hypothetical protein